MKKIARLRVYVPEVRLEDVQLVSKDIDRPFVFISTHRHTRGDDNPSSEWDCHRVLAEYAGYSDPDIAAGYPVDRILKRLEKKYTWHKVYGYSHGGLSVSVTPFSCRWDSGVFGWVLVNKKEYREIISSNTNNRDLNRRIHEYVDSVVKEYDAYLNDGFVEIEVEEAEVEDHVVVDSTTEGEDYTWESYFDCCRGVIDRYDNDSIAAEMESVRSEYLSLSPEVPFVVTKRDDL